jgi:hypothetical protein
VKRSNQTPFSTTGATGATRRARAVPAAIGFVILLAACHPVRGCAESQFELAPESRLPKWFTLPAGGQRSEVAVTLAYYPAPLIGSERIATVTLRTRQGAHEEVVATLKGHEPLTLEPHSETGPIPYPSYELLTANGVTEVIEHRRMEPVFFITDDPEVRRKLGVPH